METAPSGFSVREPPSLGPCNALIAELNADVQTSTRNDANTAQTETGAVNRDTRTDMELNSAENGTSSAAADSTATDQRTSVRGTLEVGTAGSPERGQLSTYASAEDVIVVNESPSTDTCTVKVGHKIAKI